MGTVSHLGLETDRVRVVVHDANWPVLFQEEAARLLDCLHDGIIAIEHMGSTAVPGLDAKPIIDIMVGVHDDSARESVAAQLTGMDYINKGECGIPERLFLVKGNPVTHHLHLVVYNEEFWIEHLIFRDYLRKKPEVAQDYAKIKNNLALQYPNDRESYTLGKSDFIMNVIQHALAEFTDN